MPTSEIRSQVSLDYFALLNHPRRPWLDPDLLKSRFLELSNAAHPDRFHSASPLEKTAVNERSATLNAAFQCLRNPAARLRHLLELERGEKPKNLERLPDAVVDFYLQIGRACREAGKFLAEKARASSPLLKAQMFEQGLLWSDKLGGLLEELKRRRTELERELQRLSPAWETAPKIGSPARRDSLPLDRLEEVYRSLSYLERWSAQIQEHIIRLSG